MRKISLDEASRLFPIAIDKITDGMRGDKSLALYVDVNRNLFCEASDGMAFFWTLSKWRRIERIMTEGQIDEREQLRELISECFPGALHDKPIVTQACQHSVIMRHAHDIGVHGSEDIRRQAIVALSALVFETARAR